MTNVDDCATSTCPTGDASIGVNFTGLDPNTDLSAGTFRVTIANNGTFQCAYSSTGIATNSGFCDAFFNSSTNNIECQINHLDCRNGSFTVLADAPEGYDCDPSPTSLALNNCSNNLPPITVSCSKSPLQDCNTTPICGDCSASCSPGSAAYLI